MTSPDVAPVFFRLLSEKKKKKEKPFAKFFITILDKTPHHAVDWILCFQQ